MLVVGTDLVEIPGLMDDEFPGLQDRGIGMGRDDDAAALDVNKLHRLVLFPEEPEGRGIPEGMDAKDFLHNEASAKRSRF